MYWLRCCIVELNWMMKAIQFLRNSEVFPKISRWSLKRSRGNLSTIYSTKHDAFHDLQWHKGPEIPGFFPPQSWEDRPPGCHGCWMLLVDDGPPLKTVPHPVVEDFQFLETWYHAMFVISTYPKIFCHNYHGITVTYRTCQWFLQQWQNPLMFRWWFEVLMAGPVLSRAASPLDSTYTARVVGGTFGLIWRTSTVGRTMAHQIDWFGCTCLQNLLNWFTIIESIWLCLLFLPFSNFLFKQSLRFWPLGFGPKKVAYLWFWSFV